MATSLDNLLCFLGRGRYIACALLSLGVFLATVTRTEPTVYQGSYQVDCPGVQPFRIEMYLRGTKVEYTSEGQGVRSDFSQCKLELLQ